MTVTSSAATKKCESILSKYYEYKEEHEILTSEKEVINRLLGHTQNMVHVYDELATSLNDQQIDLLLLLILSCAAFWNPTKSALYRTERQELIETNLKIQKAASSLAELIEKRDQLHNESGFSSDTHYSIANVIDNAAKNNGFYSMYLKKPLKRLSSQYDLKYWPSIEEVISELAVDAANANFYATDPLTEAATGSSRTSKVDFLRAFLAAIKENTTTSNYMLPRSFELTDKAVAEIMNCALDLDFEELVDAAYIKRARQRLREKQNSNG